MIIEVDKDKMVGNFICVQLKGQDIYYFVKDVYEADEAIHIKGSKYYKFENIPTLEGANGIFFANGVDDSFEKGGQPTSFYIVNPDRFMKMVLDNTDECFLNCKIE